MRKWADAYWDAVARQDAETLRTYFASKAVVRWHCTNEQFTAEGFIRANCEYPGQWHGQVERTETLPNGLCTVTHVWSDQLSCHAVSFFCFDAAGRIVSLDEYWGDDGAAPMWRQTLEMSRPIQLPKNA